MRIFATIFLLLLSSAAQVLEDEVPEWKFGVDLGATASWGLSQKFVGVTEGNYWSWGGKATGRANWLRGDHELRNTLSWLETFSKTPILDPILKSADQLSFDSIYLYSFNDWLGAFGQFKVDTSVFNGNDYQAANVNYIITDKDGNNSTENASTMGLTTPFQPLYLREDLGLFARPYKEKEFSWEIKPANSFRQNFANGQKVITKTSKSEINVKTLTNFYQIGPQLGTQIYGNLADLRISYTAGIDAMYVLWQSPLNKAPSFVNNLNVEAGAGLSYKMFDWMSLTWDFKAIRTPAILEDFQIRSNVLLTFTYAS